MILFAINFGEPVILEYSGVEEPGNEITLQSKVDEIGGDRAHLPKDPNINDGDVYP